MSGSRGNGRAAGGWLRLEDIAALAVQGAATRAFLSRQLTCDLSPLAPGRPLLGAWLTAKGRALALMRLLDAGDGTVVALLPAALAEDVVRRLRMFVLRDDVRIEAAPQLRVAGLIGPAVAAAAALCPPSGLPALVPISGELALLAAASAQSMEALLERLRVAGFEERDAGAWQLLLVRAAVPEIGPATREAFVPQMLNLDRLDAISFTKGCYPGQEIVARTQHLGRIKRRMFIARCDASVPVAGPGDAVTADAGGEPLGKVVLAARDGGAQEMLAVLALEAVAEGVPLRLGGAGGPALQVRPPPYPLADARP